MNIARQALLRDVEPIQEPADEFGLVEATQFASTDEPGGTTVTARDRKWISSHPLIALVGVLAALAILCQLAFFASDHRIPKSAVSTSGVSTSCDLSVTTRLAGCDLHGTDLSGKGLFTADFSGANLSGANLSSAYLMQANLTGANLTQAKLDGANLTGADLTGADLTGASLQLVRYDESTTWPSGFLPPGPPA